MELATWANWAEIAGVLAILGAAGFTIYQLRADRKARQETAAFAIVQRFMDDNAFICAVRCIKNMPPGWQGKTIQVADRESLDHVYMVLETIGFAVYRNAVRLDDVEGLMGGVIREMWAELEPLAKIERTSEPRAYEWSEWLCRRLNSARPNGGTLPFAEAT